MQAVTTVSAQAGVLAADPANAAALTAATDYAFKWKGGAQPRHVLVQNNTAASINVDVDAAATAGALVLAAGATLVLDVCMSALHLYSAAATPAVNGSASGNIVVRGWI